MPISGFTTNYSGRTTDINVLRVNSYTNQQLQKDTVGFGTPSQYVAGIEKLTQRYLISFLTEIGSQVNSPTFGTNFLNTLNQGTGQLTNIQVQHLFNFANLIVLGSFQSYQANNPGLPLDEQLQSATLITFSATADSLSITILVTSLAGTNVTFVLPIPLNA